VQPVERNCTQVEVEAMTMIGTRRPGDFKDYVVDNELEGDSGWTWKMI